MAKEMRFVGGDVTPCIIANCVRLEEKQATSDESKWIPVTEMVPESHVEPVNDIDGIHCIVISDFVLGYTADGQMVVVQHEVGDERDWWMDYTCTYYTITHWMPLPPAPWLSKGE